VSNSIKSFLKKNNKIIFCKHKSKKVLIVDRGRYDSVVRSSLIAKIFNQYYDLDPVVILNSPYSKSVKDLYKSFGIDDFNIPSAKLFLIKNIFKIPYYSLIIFFNLIKFYFLGIEKFIKEFKILNINAGDLIYDSYLRYNQSYLKPSIFTFKFIKVIFLSYIKFFIVNNIYKSNKINATIVSTDSYIGNGSVALRISLKLKIPCIYFTGNKIKIYNDYKSQYNEHFWKTNLKNVLNFNINKSCEKEFNFYLKNRFFGNQNDKDVINAYKNKSILKKNEFCDLFKFESSYKKIILFAPHAFSDSCYVSGKFIFRDYYQFFVETIDLIKNIKDILWIVKPHPTRFDYGEGNIIKNYLRNNPNDNIRLCPDNLSTLNFIYYADSVLTGRGTIGLEFACNGKKPIVVFDNYYGDFGFTINIRNKKEFINKLKNISSINFVLDSYQINLAKKVFYYILYERVHNIYKSIIPNELNVTSSKKYDYFSIFNKNLINKKDITEDSFYINTYKYIKKNLSMKSYVKNK
jgi:hypothetical protein